MRDMKGPKWIVSNVLHFWDDVPVPVFGSKKRIASHCDVSKKDLLWGPVPGLLRC